MNILLTNDDGYEAKGINILMEHLSKNHNVFMLAPDKNRSAISHGITMYKHLRLRKIRENVWSCSGKPADCAIVGIKSDFLPEKIDAVVSGINHGANLGTDAIYSGTCAAAREAVLDGKPGVAVSLEFFDGKLDCFDALASFVSKNLERLVSLSDVKKEFTFVNVNALSIPEYKGAKITNILANRKYADRLDFEEDGEEYVTHFQDGQLCHKFSDESDNGLCNSGFIAVSCIHAEPSASKVDGIKFSL